MPNESRQATTSIRKNALIATLAILGSRIFGLVREQVFAIFFGASFALDAYIAAFRIPNLLRDLFAEGALSQSFVTIFSQKTAQGKDHDAYDIANTVSTFLIFFLGLLILLGMIFSPFIVHLVANGFTGEKYLLTVQLNRILFPFILFVALAALLMGMLNAKNRFFLPQSASTFFNITSIISGILFAYWMAPDYILAILNKIRGLPPAAALPNPSTLSQAITGMALGTLLGGLMQWLIQLPALYRLGYRPRFRCDFRNADFLKILALTFPAIIGSAGVQINVMTDTFFASYLQDGAISYLNYAFRFMQFPLGLFGVAIATASAPALAKMISQNKRNDFQKTMRASLQMSLFFSLPSMVGLILLSTPIVSLIYEHGRFHSVDTLQTSFALRAFSAGIVGYSLIKIYQPAFLAFHDTKTPMKISLLSIISNAGLDYILMIIMGFGHWGLALSTSCVATLNFVLLAIYFEKKKMPGIWNHELWQQLGKCLLASLIMGLAVWGSSEWAQNLIVPSKLLTQLFVVFLPIFVALPVYLGMGMLLGIPEVNFLLKRIKRKKS